MVESVGYISQIYNGSAVDGPGLRCVIFLAGCNLRCPFCHNPETFEKTGGTAITALQAAQHVLRYKAFIKKGGVTFSGGEPLLQPQFVNQCMGLLHEHGIHCAVQTNATISNADVIKNADLVIADIKNFDGFIHDGTESFLKMCHSLNKVVHITNVIVKGVNDDIKSLEQLKKLLSDYSNIEKVTFLPFKKYCTEKYQNLNIPFPYIDKQQTESSDIARVQSIYNSL